MKMRALLFALTLIAGHAWAQTLPPLEKSEKQAVVERAGNLIVENYIFPDRAAQAKAKIADTMAAGDYDGINDASAFAARLTADLQSVTHDKHLRVFARGAAAAPPPAVQAQPMTNAGFERADRLKGNIGYIKLRFFPAPFVFALAADQAMTALAGTDALIIDMRDNGGGSPKAVEYLCSFFFDPKTPVHINDLVYRKPGTEEFTTTSFQTEPVTAPYLDKPIYLLTSNRTFSGGEEFVNDLKVQKRAKIFGEVTGGGANPGGVRPLGSRFTIFIPNGRAENPVTQSNWDGTGVAPDVAVDEKRAFHDAMIDLVGRLKARGPKRELAAVKRALGKSGDVDPLVEAHLLKMRTQALPGSADAVRRNIEALALGTPDYDRMSEDMANATREQLARLQASLGKLGAIQSVTFQAVGPGGLDIYDVQMANGAVQSGIFVSPDGRIMSAWIRPAPPAVPSTP